MPQGFYKRPTAEQRFWLKVNKTDYCWEWVAGKIKSGYGEYWSGEKMVYAHRFSWEISNGKIPEGLCVLHKCDNPSCVRPSHLFLGTNLDNSKDAVLKNRIVFGENHYKTKLTENKVRAIRDMYAAGNITQEVLGRLFGITFQSISSIINNKRWKHI